jgi:periplasmic copper chaperone A
MKKLIQSLAAICLSMTATTTVKSKKVVLGAAVAAIPVIVLAHAFKLGDLDINHPFSVTPPSGAKHGAVYFTAISNKGKATDSLIAASSPASETVELHIMKMEGDVMRMREVKEIEVPANGKVEMKRGSGYHLMLINLKKPLKEGDKFPLKLRFKNAGEVEVMVNVEKGAAVDHSKHGYGEHKH